MSDARWLVLRLTAPMMSFGAVAVDQVGPTARWPGASLLTGLFANALGWDWNNRAAHQALQDRLRFGAMELRAGDLLTDQQNARLYESEAMWTTRGVETRNEGKSYGNKEPEKQGGRKYLTHQRRRDYMADADYAVVLSLTLPDTAPTLDDLATALDLPARPLFIGRKPCLPTRPIRAGEVLATSVHAALLALERTGHRTAAWPEGEGPSGTRIVEVADRRVWSSGLHGGTRRLVEGTL